MFKTLRHIQNFGNGNIYTNIGPENIAEYQKYKLSKLENFSLVTEKFIKVLDKFYKKLYNEDFTQNVFYNQHILSIFQVLLNHLFLYQMTLIDILIKIIIILKY